MRAKLQNLQQLHSGKSFICYELKISSFDFFWHFHPEYELTYIIKGRGKRLVGDCIESFREGDLILIGPQVPHTWVSEEKRKQHCHAIVLQFPKTLADTLLSLPELEELGKVFKQASRGLKISHTSSSGMLQQLLYLTQHTNTTAITGFLQLFQTISKLKIKTLASSAYQPSSLQQSSRISNVLKYVQEHYTTHIRLKKAAAVIHLSESAFCKYFKRAMGKTFSDYVNELRITHAMMLLLETELSIQSIAYQCGFENISYFNRVFLKKNKCKPSQFRKK
ncbi:AraC family transcriptional regulator [Lacibacter sp. MH-610]|uniref:AraC family transcriptional regulator n=1 Tax=Lacibacter sp. MH-610 TaxID=3020883 RepID=UPI003891BDB8